MCVGRPLWPGRSRRASLLLRYMAWDTCCQKKSMHASQCRSAAQPHPPPTHRRPPAHRARGWQMVGRHKPQLNQLLPRELDPCHVAPPRTPQRRQDGCWPCVLHAHVARGVPAGRMEGAARAEGQGGTGLGRSTRSAPHGREVPLLQRPWGSSSLPPYQEGAHQVARPVARHTLRLSSLQSLTVASPPTPAALHPCRPPARLTWCQRQRWTPAPAQRRGGSPAAPAQSCCATGGRPRPSLSSQPARRAAPAAPPAGPARAA